MDNSTGFEGSWFFVFFLFFLLAWGGGGLFGGNGTTQAAETKADLYEGLFQNNTANRMNDISTQICNGFNNTNTAIMQGFNSANMNTLQGFNNTNMNILQGNAAIAQAIDNNRFAQQQCCCEVKTAIADQNAQNYRNTCDITNTVREQANETRALLVQQQIIDLEAKLADRDRELQTAKFEASQLAQTSALIQALAPRPIPAYASCSPYMSNYYATNGFNGCACGCGA